LRLPGRRLLLCEPERDRVPPLLIGLLRSAGLPSRPSAAAARSSSPRGVRLPSFLADMRVSSGLPTQGVLLRDDGALLGAIQRSLWQIVYLIHALIFF
jgi:hypothetical protein